MYNLRLFCQVLFLVIALSSCNNDTSQSTNSNKYSTVVPENAFAEDYSDFDDMADTGTILINGFTLNIQSTEPVTFPDYYPEQAARDSIAAQFGNWHDRATAIEQYLKNKYNKLFTANDSVLTIKLTDNRLLNFAKIPDDIDAQAYNFDHYFADIDYVLLHAQYYEGDAFTLVNRKNGFTRELYGRPYFSPDKKSFITLSLDLDACYNFNGIEYYLMQGDTVAKQFEVGMSRCGPVHAKWKSDSTVVIEKGCYIIEDDNVISGYGTEYGVMRIKR